MSQGHLRTAEVAAVVHFMRKRARAACRIGERSRGQVAAEMLAPGEVERLERGEVFQLGRKSS